MVKSSSPTAKSRYRGVVAAVALGLVILYLMWPRPSEQARITSRLQALAEEATFEGDVHVLQLAQQAKQISSEYFSSPIEFEAEYQGHTYEKSVERTELAQQFAIGRRELEQLATRLDGVAVTLDGPDRAHADFQLRAMGRAKGAPADGYFLEVFAVTVSLEHAADRDWLIRSVSCKDLRNTQ